MHFVVAPMHFTSILLVSLKPLGLAIDGLLVRMRFIFVFIYDWYLFLFMLSGNPTPELYCFSCNDSTVGEAFIFTVSQGKQKFGDVSHIFHIQSLPTVACRVRYFLDACPESIVCPRNRFNFV